MGAVAERIKPFGDKWVERLAASFLALNDKQYLPEIEQKIRSEAEAEATEHEKLKRYAEEQRKAVQLERERAAEALRQKVIFWKHRIWGTRQGKAITLAILTSAVVATMVTAWPKQYEDPFSYCEAAIDIDLPDKRYVGKNPPPIIVEKAYSNEAVWRCMHGKVLACIGDSTCRKLKYGEGAFPMPANMSRYCSAQPNADEIPLQLYYRSLPPLWSGAGWRCAGTTPMLKTESPVDDRRYIRSAWIVVASESIGSDTDDYK